MSAPDRETVRAAMNNKASAALLCVQQRDSLRDNARDVAKQLRKWADEEWELYHDRDKARSGDNLKHHARACEYHQLADQLYPQPVSKTP